MKPIYVDAETGEKYEKKPEHMTQLSGSRLVSKTHGRIRFRGCIDTLEAEVLEAQVLAADLGEQWYVDALGELLDFLRNLLSAEVKEEALPPPRLFGLSAEELHEQSHDVQGSFGIKDPLPGYKQGPLALCLNTLRTHIREAELLAVSIFGADKEKRDDIILAMNRLSSAVYWLYCKCISEKTKKEKN
jgi:ethanolamine utilization cobalamin adenosyltransferase